MTKAKEQLEKYKVAYGLDDKQVDFIERLIDLSFVEGEKNGLISSYDSATEIFKKHQPVSFFGSLFG